MCYLYKIFLQFGSTHLKNEMSYLYMVSITISRVTICRIKITYQSFGSHKSYLGVNIMTFSNRGCRVTSIFTNNTQLIQLVNYNYCRKLNITRVEFLNEPLDGRYAWVFHYYCLFLTFYYSLWWNKIVKGKLY